MELSLCSVAVLRGLVLKLLLFTIVVLNTCSASHAVQQPFCHDDESSALLQFKESFVITNSASRYEGAYPKVLQWKSETRRNCCSWDGVECDEQTGNVIGLNLTSSCLFGSINSNSTLFSLRHIRSLSLVDNDFNYSQIPAAITQLSDLTYLYLSGSNFAGPIPHSLGKLAKITKLQLRRNNFTGHIPSSFQNLTQLTLLLLGHNKISGSIPTWLGNLTKIKVLELYMNKLEGQIPQSLSKLMNLEVLALYSNNLSGFYEFDMFLNMKSLTSLQLGDSNLSLVFGKTNTNATISKFKLLGLVSCNLIEFPNFLRYQNELEWLNLSGNKICGLIPKWMLNTSVDTLIALDISDNFLTGFNQQPTALPWVNLCIFDLSYNMLQGPLPIPPPSIVLYDVSNNMQTGEVSHLFCNMTSLYHLMLSNNNLSGMIPYCLGNSSTSLSVLSLGNNSFHGVIPQICSNSSASSLRMIDFSDNKFQGQLPRSLSNCMMLEGIVVSNNQIVDSFPSWLGSLPELKLLVLQHNWFHGVIEKPKMDMDQFAKLQVIDLSSNNFTGVFPYHYIYSWNAMKSLDSNGLEYMSANWNVSLSKNFQFSRSDAYKMTVTSKRVETYYEVIQDVFAFVDLSDNKFEGEISDLFGKLKALRSLNLSNNMLTGCIPSSLGNLTDLESLDLSRNKLSGEIPQQLTELGFLGTFDVSHNNLVGRIPQGKQFNSFDASSFEGNRGLCGDHMKGIQECASSSSSPPPFPTVEEDDEDSESLLKLIWSFVLAGYISGIVVGVVLADIMIQRRALIGWLRYYRRKMGKRN